MGDSGNKDVWANARKEVNAVSEEKNQDPDNHWNLADAATTAGDFVEGAAIAVTQGLIEKAADLGSAALSGAAHVGETVADGAAEVVSAIGSILDL
jgi:hypothetical protein